MFIVTETPLPLRVRPIPEFKIAESVLRPGVMCRLSVGGPGSDVKC